MTAPDNHPPAASSVCESRGRGFFLVGPGGNVFDAMVTRGASTDEHNRSMAAAFRQAQHLALENEETPMYGETLAMNVVDNWLTAYRTALGGYCIRLWRTPEILGDRRPLAAEGLPEQFPLISRVFVLMTHPDASAESGLSFAQSMGGQKLLPGFLGGISGVVLWVLIQTNKNEVISRITRSTPNQFQLNWAFVQALLHLLGPIAIVVAAQLSGRLRSIVAPLLDVIR